MECDEETIPEQCEKTGKGLASYILGVLAVATLIFSIVVYGSIATQERNPTKCSCGVKQHCVCISETDERTK